MTKYKIQGLDCAQCANEIECALQKNEGLTDARISFATGYAYIDSRYEDQARSIIDKVEPGVTITAEGTKPEKEENEDSGKGGILRLIAAGVLFLVGSVFNADLHATPYAIVEYLVLLTAFALVGAPVLASAVRSIFRGQVFNEMFLMSIATVGAIAIHELSEAVGVMLFYAVGEFLQDRAVDRSKKSIAALMDLRPESARLFENGERRIVSPEEVSVGSLLEVLPGERVPLDGEVVEGTSFVNTSSLTGESVPRKVEAGDKVLGGFVNDEGRILVRVEKEFGQTSAARIIELVESAASHKAPTEKFITRFAAVYTPFVVIAAVMVAFLPPLFISGATFSEWIYRALVLLVISCPCALVISIPLGYFGGIGGASRNKLLIKGANYIDILTKVDTVVFDKTGTLTEGVFSVVNIVTRNGFTKDDLLGWAASAESHSTHPIARSIREAAGNREQKADDIQEVKGHGVIAKVGSHSIAVGNDRLMHRENIVHEDCEVDGTVAYVAVDGIYAGFIVISDRIKKVAAGTIADLKKLGVRKVVMLTGDDHKVAEMVASEIGLDGFFAELLPDEKVAKLEMLENDPNRNGAVVFVGDGMNDAPVLVRSDVGFAMGGLGSDAAIEAADVVVMDDDIARIPLALRISNFTRRVVIQNIVLALAVKGVFIVLGTMGVANMWEAVIADVGVALLAVLNALRTAGYAKNQSRIS
ncbi:cadmium-translocating P-type ATPase [Treponema zuelzerae]|uniref:P-type Zn(2+) transporter n=1 Tax=Teretinema zuelzerae TaxID=156 RepID=A0AAE3EFJ4_9SPIR|nr:heavy metal translocating P-type ATPase [Teretinema zuelzerae]MCD1653582.1 cadmium-translocating P-type ATPase [Teretinema zuelzerae]